MTRFLNKNDGLETKDFFMEASGQDRADASSPESNQSSNLFVGDCGAG